MTDKIDLGPMTIPFDELDDYAKPFPTMATVREIDARVADDEIAFFFSKGNYVVDLASYPGGLDGLLADVRR